MGSTFSRKIPYQIFKGFLKLFNPLPQKWNKCFTSGDDTVVGGYGELGNGLVEIIVDNGDLVLKSELNNDLKRLNFNGLIEM